jgi:hypothetical protein
MVAPTLGVLREIDGVAERPHGIATFDDGRKIEDGKARHFFNVEALLHSVIGCMVDSCNEAYERMLKSDVKYRFVIDIATL